MTKTSLACVVLGPYLAVAAMNGCNAGEPEPELWDLAAPPPEWDPEPIDRGRCMNPEVTPSRPPDPSGHCDVELRLASITYESGQGASEGRGEIAGDFTATSGTEHTSASTSSAKYTVDQTNGFSKDLGTYRVEVGHTRNVEVCATFTEDDSGLNGGDDTAHGCRTLTLGCNARTGQPSFNATIGPLQLCGKHVCNGSVSAEISVMASDADMDEIPNDDDFTPELCDEERKATAGVAALIYFHYDDSGLKTLAQSLWTDLSQVYAAYDRVVLVADNETSNPSNTSGAAWADADVVLPPTREGLLDAMQDLTSRGYKFDTFIHAHGYKAGSDDSDFETLAGSSGFISGAWLVEATDPNLIGTARGGVPIVAWWSTTCIALRQLDAWLEIGAVTASGAPDVQFQPNAWGPFVQSWIGGQTTYRKSVDDSITGAVVVESEAIIVAQAALPPWLCPGAGLSVLDQGGCAEDFFIDIDGDGPDEAAYNIAEIYVRSASGAANMMLSSLRWFAGDTQIAFGGGGHTWP
jgi:hypothetical protein